MWVCRAGQVHVSKLRKMCCFHLIANKNENFSFPLYPLIPKHDKVHLVHCVPFFRPSTPTLFSSQLNFFCWSIWSNWFESNNISVQHSSFKFGYIFLFAHHFDRQNSTDVKLIHFMLLKISFARTSYRPFFLHMMKMSQKGNLKIIINMFANNQWVCFFSLKT